MFFPFRTHDSGLPELQRRTSLMVMVGVMLAAIISFGMPHATEAHATLQSSSPANGDIVTTMPPTISATFAERLEKSESSMELFDSQGQQIPGTTLQPSNDDYTMVLQVPSGLPNGTYSVLWNNLSADDGHTAEGYFTFTVGTTADVSAAVAVPTNTVGGGPPQWLKTASRWAALVGFAAFLATWPIWTIVIRPALSGIWQHGPEFTHRMRRYALIACIFAILGSAFALLVQALSLSNGTFFDKLMNTIGQTRFGKLWLLRIGLIILEGLILSACAWWFVRHRRLESAAAWVVALALPIPFSLISHASAQPMGRAVAIAADIIHLLAAGIWIGGIFILTTVFFPVLRKLDPHQRRQVLIVALPRFSLLAIVAWAALGLTGFYAGWLQVGNLHALTTTPYGQSLIVKLILLAVALTIAAINLLVIERQISRKISDDAAKLWSKRIKWTVTAELVLILGVLGAVGQMTSQEPARDVLIERSKQIAISYPDTNPPSKLLLAPGIAGVNHFRLEVGGDSLPTETAALVRLSMPENANLGIKEITLSRVAGNAFEYHGSDLGIVGDWKIMMILREPGKAQIEATAETTIGSTAPKVDVPGAPWRFKTTGGVTGLLLILIGIGAVAFAVYSGRGRLRKETGGAWSRGTCTRDHAPPAGADRSDPGGRRGRRRGQPERRGDGRTRQGCLHLQLPDLSWRGSAGGWPRRSGHAAATGGLLATAHDGALGRGHGVLDRERQAGNGDARVRQQALRSGRARCARVHQESAAEHGKGRDDPRSVELHRQAAVARRDRGTSGHGGQAAFRVFGQCKPVATRSATLAGVRSRGR